MVKTEILTTKVLCKQPGRYIGWPSITKAKNGDILAVFSGDRYGHVCMAGKTQMVRSKDGGKTWGDPETITNTPLDDRDAGIITLADGTLLVSWFISYFHPDNPRINKWDLENSWRPYIEKITEEDKGKWLGRKKSDDSLEWTSGNWIRTSKDHGYTWDEPVKVVASSPHGPIELSDGSLVYLALRGRAHCLRDRGRH